MCDVTIRDDSNMCDFLQAEANVYNQINSKLYIDTTSRIRASYKPEYSSKRK